jgi:hypothetical protein
MKLSWIQSSITTKTQNPKRPFQKPHPQTNKSAEMCFSQAALTGEFLSSIVEWMAWSLDLHRDLKEHLLGAQAYFSPFFTENRHAGLLMGISFMLVDEMERSMSTQSINHLILQREPSAFQGALVQLQL